MYRVSPFTYWVGAMAAAMLHGRQVVCTQQELSIFQPPAQQTCGQYLATYLTAAPGSLQNPDATSDCAYCSVQVADTFLNSVGISWDQRWRDFGLFWAYIVFNIFACVVLYYFFRVRKNSKKSKTSKKSKKSKKGGENDEENKNTKKENNVPTATNPQDGPAADDANRSQSTSTPSNSRAQQGGVMSRSLSTAQNMGATYLTYNLGRTRTNERNAHII